MFDETKHWYCKLVCAKLELFYLQGLDMTEKANYGGGDTDWEETRLRQYSKR